MIVYELEEEQLQTPDGSLYTAFGICAWQVADGVRRAAARIPDVFLEKGAGEAFIKLCNELGLELIHLPDVVEDLLCGA